MNRMCPCIHPGCFCLLRRECRITRTCFVPDCIHDILAQKMEFAMLKNGDDIDGNNQNMGN